MSTAEFIHQMQTLPEKKRTQTMKHVLARLYPKSRKVIDRLLRRIEHPEVPEDFWGGVEDIEDGRTVDLDTALTQPYPGENGKRGRV